ncbi:VOC family protein [Streptomyces sp. NPDC127020]|uniref:VOC family protein n=1 Tax=Streptomyces sp. NPDC127020 TaxID=3347109 RepID=UPI0036598474
MNIIASAVLLTVGHPEASSRFFTTHLGFREVLVADDVIHLSRDDAATDLVVRRCDRCDTQPHPEQQPAAHAEVMVSFAVTDLAAEHERLRREGARILMPLRQEPWGEWVLQLLDPNGVVIQIVEWVPPVGA